MICLTTACEIGRACLLVAQMPDEPTSYGVESVSFILLSITSAAILLRVIEVRKNKSGEKIKWAFDNLCTRFDLDVGNGGAERGEMWQ